MKLRSIVCSMVISIACESPPPPRAQDVPRAEREESVLDVEPREPAASEPEPPVAPVNEEPPAPPAIVRGDLDAPRIAIGAREGCAIGDDGRVWCFPLPRSGDARAVPVDGVEGAVSVAAGATVSCAATADHRAFCWGGFRLYGSPAPRLSWPAPTHVAELTDVRAIAVGVRAVCARDGAGAIQCFGQAPDDERGAPHAFRLATEAPAVRIAATDHALCAVLEDARTFCWGGVGFRTSWGRAAPAQLEPPDVPIGMVSLHQKHRCALAAAGDRIFCGGDIGEWYWTDVDFEDEERGPVSEMEMYVDPTTEVPITVQARMISSAIDHACLLTTQGAVHCWGTSYRDGRTEGFRARPAPRFRSGVTEIASGGDEMVGLTCAVRGDVAECFRGLGMLGRGTPGEPAFRICRDGEGPCDELRLVRRAGSSEIAAEPPSAPPASCRWTVRDPSDTPLNVRAEPNGRAPIVGTLEDGANVDIEEERGRWRRVRAPAGWVWGENLVCE
jgi:hypothetical protein